MISNMSDAELLREIKKSRPDADLRDVSAFRRFAKNFHAEDSETYQEAHEKVVASMELLGDELDGVSDEEGWFILRRAYKNL